MIPQGETRTFFQVVLFTGLSPGTTIVASANEARAKFSTLPAALPRFGQRPLSVLLGSCYFKNNDHGVARLIQAITRKVQPDLKFLCGDQVYLDFPSFLLGIPFTERGQAQLFLSKYLQNWGGPGGLKSVLKEGATWFSADDHEYWNNFPNAATLISATWTSGRRDRYRRIARSLYDTFQKDSVSDRLCRVFRIDPLEFMVVDTRSGREQGDEKFMTSVGLDTLTSWVDGLRGPGVLVTGQPLFVEPHTGFFGLVPAADRRSESGRLPAIRPTGKESDLYSTLNPRAYRRCALPPSVTGDAARRCPTGSIRGYRFAVRIGLRQPFTDQRCTSLFPGKV